MATATGYIGEFAEFVKDQTKLWCSGDFYAAFDIHWSIHQCGTFASNGAFPSTIEFVPWFNCFTPTSLYS